MIQWIVDHHYLASAPPGAVGVLDFTDGDSNRIGAMMVGRPTNRNYHPDLIQELTRMCFIDETPPNTESRALALMRKWVRTWLPNIKLLLAYADPEVGHEGIIYLADGWAPLGKTKEHNSSSNWRSRGGERHNSQSSKIRYVRTP